MKKIILAVILLAAAGGVTYYLLQKKKQNVANSFQQEQIIGQWRVDSVTKGKDPVEFFTDKPDSIRIGYNYDFKKENIVVKSFKDSVIKDTIRYQWTKDNHLVWKGQGDSVGQFLSIAMLTKDSLVLQTRDSAVIYFTKAK